MDISTKTASAESFEGASLFGRLVNTLMTFGLRVGERRALAELSVSSLEDIGLDPDVVERELNRPLWG